MAYPMPIGSIVEVVLRAVATNQECLTVLHMRLKSGTPPVDGRATIVNLLTKLSLADGLFNKWALCISSQVQNLTMRAQMVYPVRYLPVNAAAGYEVGLVDEPMVSSNLAVAITRQGEAANRRNTGTTHMPGVPATFLDNTLVTAGGNAAYGAFATLAIGLETITGGQVFEHVIFNKAAPPDSVDPVQFKVQPYGRTMHRRTVGLGS